MILSTTLRDVLEPGTNLKHAASGARWVYLLPSLELGTTLVVGRAPAATVATLAGLSREVLVVTPQGPADVAERGLPPNVRTVSPRPDAEASLAEGSAGVLVLAEGWEDVGLLDPADRDRFLRLLAPGGRIYTEFGAGSESGRVSCNGKRSRVDLGSGTRLWLQLVAGEVRAAAPADDPVAVEFLSASNGPAPDRPWIDAAARLVRRKGGGRDRRLATGMLAGRGPAEEVRRPPRYLVEAAQEAGLSLAAHRWALLAAGNYPSKKVLLFLFPPDSSAPEYVVKLTREPRFNGRLENARRALTQLEERRLVRSGSVPTVAFHGREAGLAFLAERIVDGRPLRAGTNGSAARPDALAALDWIEELGATSADAASATAGQAADALASLLERFVQTYGPTGGAAAFLERQVSMLGDGGRPFPLVFQHGDPGTWNALVDPQGQPVFLDWEAAEPRGMPLWDLFYFLRSYGVGAARTGRRRDALGAFERQFLRRSGFSTLLARRTARLCERVGLDPGLVEPLFYTCWMHRSLKEARTLPESRVHDGHYVRLLRRCIEARQSPGLQEVFFA